MMTRLSATLLALTLGTAPTLAADDGLILPKFADETATAGIDAEFSGGWEYMVGGGAASFDCNDDQFPDVVIAGGTNPATVYINRSTAGSALRFEKMTDSGLDLTAVSGAYPLDIDSDGIMDVVLLRVGENKVMRGLGGCRFKDANAAFGFDGGDGWSTAFAATFEKGADWPTIAIGNYINRTEDAFPWGSCTDNWLHRGGNGRFDPPLPLKPSFCALSMLVTDWNNSGHASLRVSNDREYYKGGQEQLWHIEPGEAPRLYTEAEGWQRLRIWGMGIASADLNHDRYPEYFLTSMADNKLQTLAAIPPEGNPKPKFADVAFAKGVTAHRPYTGGEIKPSTAWHAAFEDVNNDGRDDLFVAKGNVWEMPDFAQKDPNNLLVQKADGTFQETGDIAGVASMRQSRGAALADFNRDGLIDLLVVNRNDHAEIWRNVTENAGHFLELEPRQRAPNVNALGGWIEVDANGIIQRREITLGGGHAGDESGPIHFGLGAATTAKVRVTWPDGTATDWMDAKADQFLVVEKAWSGK